MPPKKKEEEKPTPLMGRFGTSLKCGIVGLPNVGLAKIKEWIDNNDKGATIIPFSGELEEKLVGMSEEDRESYCKEHGTQSALHKIITIGFKILQLEYFFTSGKDEVKAWTILKGTKAPQAAGKIHTDFEKGFIMAEVMKFSDFKELGSEHAVKGYSKSSPLALLAATCSKIGQPSNAVMDLADYHSKLYNSMLQDQVRTPGANDIIMLLLSFAACISNMKGNKCQETLRFEEMSLAHHSSRLSPGCPWISFV
ncbi:hypothetical protein QZH41_019775 [Actinostola sp. cb2023]|nr:hypothetical protein QZH41_019775 [Actinostola sp. cb2023]